MNRYDAVQWEQVLRQLGPLTALGCTFLLGGVLGSFLASLIAGEAAQNLETFLTDYLIAAQAGDVMVADVVGTGPFFSWGMHFGGNCLGSGRDSGIVFCPWIFIFLFCGCLLPDFWSGRFAASSIFVWAAGISVGSGTVFSGNPVFGGGLCPAAPGAGGQPFLTAPRYWLLGKISGLWIMFDFVCGFGVYGGPGSAAGSRSSCVVRESGRRSCLCVRTIGPL